MYKKLVISAVVLAIALPVFAQTDGGEQAPVTGSAQGSLTAPKGMPRPGIRNGVAPIRRQKNDDVNAARQGVKMEIENERADVRGEVEKEREDVTAERQAAMQALQVQAKAIHADAALTAEQKKAKLEALRQTTMQANQDAMLKFKQDRERAMKDFKAKAEEARAKLKVQVQGIKVVARQEAAIKIGSDLNALNKKATDQMGENLTKIAGVLAQINDKVTALATAGTNVTSAQAAVSAAQVSVASAQAAVTVQTSVVYTLTTPTTDTTAKADFAALAKKLRTDVEVVQKLVAKARDDVRAAANALRPIPEAHVEVEAGASAQSN